MKDTTYNKNISVKNKTTHLDLLVKITSVVLCVFLAAYFLLTLNNMSTISDHVERRKDGAYPVSVAAGHLESNLATLTAISAFTTDLDDASFDSARLKRTFQELIGNMDSQMAVIESAPALDQATKDVLYDDYRKMIFRINAFIFMAEGGNHTNDELKNYVRDYIAPSANDLLREDNLIIDMASEDLEEMYESTTGSAQQTIVFSLCLICAVLVLIVIYLVLLSRKQQTESDLMNNLSDALYVAQNANDAKSAFLSNMSHDVRTPLNAIIGLTKIAEDTVDDPVLTRQYLEQITTSSHHLLRLINDVLDMNKIERGGTILAKETFSLGALLSEIEAIVAPPIREKRLDYELKLVNVQHEYLVGDTMRLRQIFLNLINNATKYTNEGDDVHIEVEELPSVDPATANFRFTVSDTGIGMKEEFLQYIFDPFERERNDFTNFVEGTGLGMAITKNLVNMMGGDIRVESELGLGSTFTINLSFEIADEMPALDTSRFAGMTILTIDDNEATLYDTVNMLKEFSIKTYGKYPGEFTDEAKLKAVLEKYRNFDAILVDIGSSDEEVIEYMRGHLHQVFADAGIEKMPPIILALNNWRKFESDAREAGAVAFVEKPLFRTRLYDVLQTVQKAADSAADAVGVAGDVAEAGRNEGSAADGAGAAQSASADSTHNSEIRSGGDGVPQTESPAASPKTTDSKKGRRANLKGRVLIVEDNEINMQIAQALVSKFGPEVEGAADGLEALNKVKNSEDGYYDLVFMDWQMPHMNGIESTKEIIAFNESAGRSRLPIVAMTANAFNEDKRVALESGMDGFIAKPIDIGELERYLRKFLHE